MERIIVVLDDAEFALKQILPLRLEMSVTQWILVACPPRLTRHISRWVNHASREAWRTKWSQQLFDGVRPVLLKHGDQVVTCIANGPLAKQTQKLQADHGVARVLDARRPKLGTVLQPATPDQPVDSSPKWVVPGSAAAMGAILVLAAE
jgi:hypothetical protein